MEEVPKENYKFKILRHLKGRKNQGNENDKLCSLRKKEGTYQTQEVCIFFQNLNTDLLGNNHGRSKPVNTTNLSPDLRVW